MQVVLQSVTKLDNDTLNHLAYDIASEFENKATVSVGTTINLRADPQFQFAFNSNRNQWYSFKLLDWILDKFKPTRGTKVLGIFDIAAYSDGFGFVFGEAFYRGRAAVVYLPRIKQQFYAPKANRTPFYERLVKEAEYELGHVLGFGHCKNPHCIMYFSTSLQNIDTKARSFCPSCTRKYFKLD